MRFQSWTVAGRFKEVWLAAMIGNTYRRLPGGGVVVTHGRQEADG